MARRTKRYGALTREVARGSATDALRSMKRGEKYVDMRLSEGDCVGALFGVIGIARDAGVAAAYRYEGGKSMHKDVAERRVGRIAGKVAKSCGLPRNWAEWK